MEKQKHFVLAVVLRVLLNIVRWMLLVSGIVLLFIMTIAILTPYTSFPLFLPVRFELDSPHHQIHTPTLGIDNIVIEEVSGFLTAQSTRRGLIAVEMLLLVIVFGSGWITVNNLWRMMHAVTKGTPFVRENARRLRDIGLVFMAAEVLCSITMFFVQNWMAANFTLDNIRLKTSFYMDWSSIIFGLVTLVFAEIFRRGTTLEEDQSLTV